MKDTGFWVDTSKVDRVTSMFTYGPDKRLVRASAYRIAGHSSKPAFLSGSGGLLSTTDDYFRFAQMMLNGGEANGKRFLKASTVELMRTNVLAEGVEVDTYGPAQPGIGFGLDFAIVMDPAAANTRRGADSFYWGGAFGTWFWLDPMNDIVVVGMIQNVGGSSADRRHRHRCDRCPGSWCIRRWSIARNDFPSQVSEHDGRSRSRWRHGALTVRYRRARRAGATGRSSRRRTRAGPDARQRTHPHHGRTKHRREHGDHPQRPLRGGRQCGAIWGSPPATQVIDLRGRTVVPGLIDTHLHGLDTADRPGYHALDVESATSIREVQDVLAAHRKTVPEGQWITAIGAAHPNLWSEHRFPTLKELDDAVPDRPVLLYQGFNGAAATNTLGKKFFDAADAAPPLHPDYKGVHVSETGAIGESNAATGGPSTNALYLLRRLQKFEDKKRNALRTMAYSTSVGLTAWLDKSTIYALGPLHPRQGSANVDPYKSRDAWNAVHTEGRMSMRVQMDFTAFAERDDNAMLKEYLRNALPYFGDDMLRTGGIGEWPAPAAAVEQTRAAQRLVAQARWRCDNDAANLRALTQLVEQLEDVNKDVDITGLRWNVNLLGTGVGWVTAGLSGSAPGARLQHPAVREQLGQLEQPQCRRGSCVPDDQSTPDPQEPLQQRHPHLAAEPVAASLLRRHRRELVRAAGQPR